MTADVGNSSFANETNACNFSAPLPDRERGAEQTSTWKLSICGRFSTCAYRSSPLRPSSPKRIDPVEDVSSSQHLLSAGLRRPLVAALLTTFLTEHRHDHCGAATGTGFCLRCRGVRACINPTFIRPPNLMSGCLVYREKLFAFLALREFVVSRQPNFLAIASSRIKSKTP